MRGKHIELLLVDGMPGGLTTAEMAGWTEHILLGSCSDLEDLLRLPEASRNGAYLLLGDEEEAVHGVRCYVGRTENFANRFRDHLAKKEFWDRAVIITANDDGFNERHWVYLEARLVELATTAQRSSLTNDQTPQPRRLSEAQQSDMEAFILQLQIVLTVLGVSVIRVQPKSADAQVESTPESQLLSLVNKKLSVDAKAEAIAGKFTLLAGSVVVGSLTGAGKAESLRRSYANYRAQHERLVADGSIVVEGAVGRLTRDVPFSSPSTAGAVALGGSCNGRIEWTWSGGTYATWENRGAR